MSVDLNPFSDLPHHQQLSPSEPPVGGNPFSDLPWRCQEMATLGLWLLSWMLQPC